MTNLESFLWEWRSRKRRTAAVEQVSAVVDDGGAGCRRQGKLAEEKKAKVRVVQEQSGQNIIMTLRGTIW